MSFPLPLPPQSLRSIVVGDITDEQFLIRGRNDFSLFLGLYERHAVERPPRVRVLDFGCGCGRLTRYLNDDGRFEPFACDLNPEHVAWCKANLPNVGTVQNGPAPPSPFPDNSMDFVYALSVMTHLPEQAATAWMADFARVLRPNGIAIITTHGYPCLSTVIRSKFHQDMLPMSEELARVIASELPEAGYVYVPYTRELVRNANVGEEYGLSFTDPTYAKTIWRRFFRWLAYIPGGLAEGWQDVFVLAQQREAYRQDLAESNRNAAELAIERQKSLELIEKNAALERQIEGFVWSASWRVTRPIRVLKGALMRLRRWSVVSGSPAMCLLDAPPSRAMTSQSLGSLV